ncbi:MAG: ParD-like family protein, partial [Proteobacteria bacterium]|nr:ParD-like family protein [Pseudomonadota bacterium]
SLAMSTPLRVNNTLFKAAEVEGAFMRRSAAKQVEFWAELGKTLSQSITNTELLALMQGIAKVRVDLPTTVGIDPQALFDQVNKKRKMGNLCQKITLNQL